MPDIIVAFNHTTTASYVSNAKATYSITYADNAATLKTTATIKVDFYIKPDSYTYTEYTSDTLYLGIRKGSESAAMEKKSITTKTKGGTVKSNTYNLIGSATFTVEYTSTAAYTVYLCAGYTNTKTSRFAPFYMPKGDGGSYKSYSYTSGGSNAVTLEKRFDYTACTAPTAFTATPNPFEGAVSLSWSGAASGVSNAISSYEIQYCTSANNSSWTSRAALTTVSTTAASGSTSTTPSLTRGYYIKYRIRARGAAGESWYSAWKESASIRKNSQPTAPTAFSVSLALVNSGTSVTLSWSGASDVNSDITRYRIQKSVNSDAYADVTTVSTAATSGSTSIKISEAAGAVVRFQIRTEDALGAVSAWKTGVTVTVNSAPAAPTAFSAGSALVVSGTSVKFSWSGASDTNSNIAKYEIQKSTDGSTWAAAATASTTAASGSVNIAVSEAAGSKVQYRIRTLDVLGLASGWKTGVTVTVNSAPAAPTAFFTTASVIATGSSVTLSWSGASDANSNISLYRVQKSTNGTTWADAVTVLTTATSGSTAIKISDAAGTTAQFRVRTEDALGAVSAWKTGVSINVVSAPGAPTAFTASPTVFESNVTLSWSGATNGALNTIVGLEIQWTQSMNAVTWGSWNTLRFVETTAGNGSITDTPSIDRASYIKWRIRTKSTNAVNQYSDWRESNAVRKNSVPIAPTSIKTDTSITKRNDKVTVTYSGLDDINNNITDVRLYKSVNSGEWQLVASLPAAQKSGTYAYAVSDAYGDMLRFGIQVKDAFNCTSDLAVSPEVKVNTPPSEPTTIALNTAEVSFGDPLRVTWSGAEDPDENIARYEIGFFDGNTYTQLSQVIAAEGEGSITITIDRRIPEDVPVQVYVRAADALGEFSDYALAGEKLRQYDRNLYIFKDGERRRASLYLCVNGKVEKKRLFICKNGVVTEMFARSVTVPEKPLTKVKRFSAEGTVRIENSIAGVPVRGTLTAIGAENEIAAPYIQRTVNGETHRIALPKPLRAIPSDAETGNVEREGQYWIADVYDLAACTLTDNTTTPGEPVVYDYTELDYTVPVLCGPSETTLTTNGYLDVETDVKETGEGTA